ncbi:MAG TPA: PhzF family phenazine biosynthesis protein [Sphingobium sp.]|uniref:PhzF family phenazine biosynthesis protein n=1 Tax=Sphingobium sp. TaxID=1912891 RepID=UPI002ED02A2C
MTRALPFTQVDAFADAPFTGNPAAVMPLDEWLADDVLQAIAMENNLAETAFTVPLAQGSGADYELRWFTPTVEIALCGHATLASGHVLIGDGESLTFRTRKAGDLLVARTRDGLSLRLPDWRAEAKPLPDFAAAMRGEVVETLWREGGYGVFVYPDEAAIRALEPDFFALKGMGNILLIATAPGEIADVVSRAFLPGGGIEEDPVTGSAHCVIAAYWAQRLGRNAFTAYQASARGGHLGVRLGDDGVTLTGGCRTVITGEFLL